MVRGYSMPRKSGVSRKSGRSVRLKVIKRNPDGTEDRRFRLLHHPRPEPEQTRKIKEAFPHIAAALENQDQDRAVALAEKAGIPADDFRFILQDPGLLIRFAMLASPNRTGSQSA